MKENSVKAKFPEFKRKKKLNHKITEWSGLESALKGHLQLYQASQSPVHPGLEWIQISRYVFEILLNLLMFAQLNAKSCK